MGIIFKQSFKNTLIIYSSFIIGGINTLILYPRILGDKFYGMVAFLLSYSNLIMPLVAFGTQYTIIKFFSGYTTKEQRDRFLTLALFLPLLVALPMGFLWDMFHNYIVSNLTDENIEIANYTIYIYIIAICCAYFETFYSWSKVHLQTVFGNVLKEFWNRAAIMLLLFAVLFDWLTNPEFIYVLTIMYTLRTLVMMLYAFKVYLPKFSFKLPHNFIEILKYSPYIILAGSAGVIILDIDKVMIPGKETIVKAAYYSVAVFIGSVIEAPGRAMAQILHPLTSKSLNDNDSNEVESLYKKSSINLLLIGGLFFLLVNCNVTELFKIMPQGYEGGGLVVLLVSAYKLYTMFLGNNVSIIQNSKFYKAALPIGVGSALLVYSLNKLFYYELGLGTEGLALSTFITALLFNTFRLWFVKNKFNITPFSKNTIKMITIIVVLFLSFYFWSFSVPQFSILGFPIHPIINIILKTILITVIYLFLVIKLNISTQINALVSRFVKL